MADRALTDADLSAADEYVPSWRELDNEAYLVSRGVRPLALVGHCPADPVVMLRVRTLLNRARQAGEVIAFIVTEGGAGEGMAAFGYAAHRWAVDLLEWALSGAIPPARKHEILGLLCGYSPAAIARHQEREGMWEYWRDQPAKESADV
jgi:hypothetical protein